MQRLPNPPFTRDTALAKVQATENAWNTRDAKKVAQAYSPDCIWRNREEEFQGRAAIEYFLNRKWAIESHYRLMKELWAFTDNRISVRFVYEWQHAESGQWYRSHGNEHWEFDANGYMTVRDMSANDVPITADDRRIKKSFTDKRLENTVKTNMTIAIIILAAIGLVTTAGAALPDPGVTMVPGRTALLMTDSQNDFLFDRKDALTTGGFEGSGADWLEQYKKYINDGETVVSNPHKVYGPETNDLVLQLRKRGVTNTHTVVTS